MMIFISIVFSSFLLLSQNSQAIDEDVFTIFAVNCKEKVELLDYKEFYTMYPAYQFDVEGKNSDEIMDNTLAKFEKFEQGRSQVYKHWYSKISKKVKFVRNINFGDHLDNLGFLIWDGCKIEQLAKGINFNNEGKTLIINEDLWKRMDAKSQVGTYLNYFFNIDYVLYQENRTTENTRYFNGLLSSSQFNKIEPKSYPYIYESILDYRNVSFFGMFFEVRGYASPGERSYSVKFSESGELVYGKYDFGRYMFLEGKEIIHLAFFNAPKFFGRTGSTGSFRPDESGLFEMKSFNILEKNLCLGSIKLQGDKYVDLKLKIKSKRIEILEVTGLFRHLDKLYTTIIYSNGDFKILESSLTTRENSYKEILLGDCE